MDKNRTNTRRTALPLCMLLLCAALSGCKQADTDAVSHRELLEPTQLQGEEEAGIPGPGEEVALWMDNLLQWEVKEVATSLDGYLSADTLSAFAAVAQPLLEQVEYQVGNSKITGNRAEVDVAVTAPDLSRAGEDLALEVMGRVTVQRALDVTLSDEAFLTRRISELLEDEGAITVTRNATVHLVQGGDGRWKLDLSDSGNLGFLSALSGGLLDLSDLLVEAPE